MIFDFKIDMEKQTTNKEISSNSCPYCYSPKSKRVGIVTNPKVHLINPFQKTEPFPSIEMDILNFIKQHQPSEETEKDFVFIKLGDLYEKIMFDSILFIECQKNYLHLTTAQGEYRIRATITAFSTKLSGVFIKTHKSFIANSTKIDNFNNHFISIKNKKIPISKTYREEVLIKLNHFLL
jgi:DNA-binding LytR/AlgR family response regulator